MGGCRLLACFFFLQDDFVPTTHNHRLSSFNSCMKGRKVEKSSSFSSCCRFTQNTKLLHEKRFHDYIAVDTIHTLYCCTTRNFVTYISPSLSLPSNSNPPCKCNVMLLRNYNESDCGSALSSFINANRGLGKDSHRPSGHM